MNNQFATKPKVPPKFSFSFSAGAADVKMSDKAFTDWRAYIYQLCGIYFQDNKKYLLESRLQKRLKFLKLKSFEEYLNYIKFNPKRSSELKYLYEVITINETFFFRNKPQLDALVSSVVPSILEKKVSKTLKIWSAASSSGEEAYSISMILNELVKPKYPTLKYEIVGTDINYQVIENAKKAIYREYSIRNLPALYLKKYFKEKDKTWEVNPDIKKMVSFKTLNLSDDAAMRIMMNYDIIFCANVLIYFDMQSKIKVVSNLYNSLNKNGYLFIGYSETLHSISRAFKLTSFPKTIGYHKE